MPGSDSLEARVKALRVLLGQESPWEDLCATLAVLPLRECERWFLSEKTAVRAILFCAAPAQTRLALSAALAPVDRTELFFTVSHFSDTSAAALRALCEEAEARLKAARSKSPTRRAAVGGREAARTLVSGLAPHLAEKILSGLDASGAQGAKALCSDLRASVLTIERLTTLFPSDRAKVLAALSARKLVVFLHGVRAEFGAAVAEAFLSSLSQSRRSDIEEQIRCLGNVTGREVREAQVCFIDSARALEARGAIVFPWKETWVP